MAQRRMLNKKITDSDAFLDMPDSTQNLYFHMNMHADDDGFNGSPKRVMRMIGANDDDYKILVAKRFLIVFESGVCVIKHWRIHNYIAKDRYSETSYLEEKKALEIKKNGAYTECIQDVDILETQVRVGKGRLGEVRLENTNVPALKKFGEFENVKLSEDDHKSLIDSLGEATVQGLIQELSGYMASTGKRYKSHKATIQNWARRKGAQQIKRKVTVLN